MKTGLNRCTAQELTVLYDGACPLCSREIELYRRAESDVDLVFTDVSKADVPLPQGTTREQLASRFHVRSQDGQLHDGASAFVLLWSVLPGWRWLAHAARLPGAMYTLEGAYSGFLRVRPYLQRLTRRIFRRAGQRHQISD